MPTSKYGKDKYKRRRKETDNSHLSDKEFYAEVENGDAVADGTEFLSSLTE